MTETTQSGFNPAERLKKLPSAPGVYRMLDADATVIYVGKAKNLKRRVSNYFTKGAHDAKTQTLVAHIADIQVTITHTEAEALILENNLIKEYRPRYNVLLRDDKSYPYIHLSRDQRYPRLSFHRGSRRGSGKHFGPFPSAGAVRQTLNELQKVFPVRQCRDSFFENRSRPCLQYQIKRCTAPCVGFVSDAEYEQDVRNVEKFLEGNSNEVIEEMVARMEAASEAWEFERAAQLRDRIAALRRIQEKQFVEGARGDVDVVACVIRERLACVQVFVIRDGHNLGNQTYFPRIPDGTDEAEVLYGFVARHYLGRETPDEVLLSHECPDAEVLADALSSEAGRRIRVSSRVRSDRKRWVNMAVNNAEHALQARTATQASMDRRFEDLQEHLELDEAPQRLECFDISHTQGEATVASCVVFNREGPLKDAYRRFNISGIEGGDDYAAMRQALERRYTRLKEGEAPLPDLLVIDGGQGQLSQAVEILQELQVEGVTIASVAKGPRRRPGEEVILVAGRSVEYRLPPDSPGLHLVQQIRDEAHRFAITGHRSQRGKARRSSTLENIPGLGPKRRQALLKHFGGLRGVSRAGVDDLARVPGISQQLAERIHDHLNG
jgi:excinuclease ABC subunit C